VGEGGQRPGEGRVFDQPTRTKRPWRSLSRTCPLGVVLIATFLGANDPKSATRPEPAAKAFKIITPSKAPEPAPEPNKPSATPPASPGVLTIAPEQIIRSLQPVLLLAAVSLAPAALLMVTAFVRINIVLLLLRQALGSPQVPGNQVVTALAFLLTALVMQPTGEAVYAQAIEPYRLGKIDETKAWQTACRPVKAFMLEQIERTNHANYLWKIYDEVVPETPDRVDPVYPDDFPLRVVAPAFLLSEITTALVIGFLLYLPFLVVDLVVSAVLAAMGLFMLPPSLVSLPLKLILFVLADGWLHVAAMLLRSFGPGSG
jgi:flagellar biosynthetic protein FliP